MTPSHHPASRVLGLLAGAAFLLPVAAAAQPAASPPPPPATANGKQVYTPADFARFAPKTAHDMLVQAPGFVIRQADQERGLGQASENVLVDGKRVANKSGGAISELQKLPADNVERIEIVDAATLDIPGLSGRVANVITKATKKTGGRFTYTPEFRARYSDPNLLRGDISYTAVAGPVEFTIGLENPANRSAAGGPTTIYSGAFVPTEFRDDAWHFNRDAPKLSLRLTLDGPGSSVGHLGGFYERYYNRYHEDSRRDAVGASDYLNLFRERTEGFRRELSGDYEFALGPGRLKLVGLATEQDDPFLSTLRTHFADGAPTTGSSYARHARTKETIGRAEYSFGVGRSDFQLSAEAAFNDLRSIAHLGVLSPADTFDETLFAPGTGSVSEDRYEVLATWGRPLGPKLTLQLVLGAERSTLASRQAQTSLTRTFFRPKGSLSLAWKASDELDLSLKLRRRVGQLNFYDFLATVNLNSKQNNAGNLELVPPQSWEAEVEANRNLGRWGTTRLRVYAHLIDDLVDTVPIGPFGESPGNVDRASRHGVSWVSTFNLDPMGWTGAKLNTTVQFQHSRVRDPLTDTPRPISFDLERLLVVSLRHDIPRTDWAWGSALEHFHGAHNYRLTEVGRQHEGPVWLNAYVEHKDVLGLTMRATVGNILGAGSFWERTVFAGRRTDPVLFEERRRRNIGPIFTFQVRGSF